MYGQNYGYGAGAQQIIGGQGLPTDELEALDYYSSGAYGAPPQVAIGYDQIIGADDEDFLELMAAAGALPAQPVVMPNGQMAVPMAPVMAPPVAMMPQVVAPQIVGPPMVPQPMVPMAPPQMHPHQMAQFAALAAKMKAAKAIDKNAVLIEDVPANQRREFPLGFTINGPTPAGGSAVATAAPQVTFRPERLIVPSFIAPFFTIDNIIVGKDSQQVAANPLPASTFSEVAVGVRLNLKTAVLGMIISIQFSNVDTNERTFQATLIGTAVE